MQSILCVAPCNPRGSLVDKNKENHFCGAFLTEKTGLVGCNTQANLLICKDHELKEKNKYLKFTEIFIKEKTSC